MVIRFCGQSIFKGQSSISKYVAGSHIKDGCVVCQQPTNILDSEIVA